MEKTHYIRAVSLTTYLIFDNRRKLVPPRLEQLDV
jgi:hypothetical protein